MRKTISLILLGLVCSVGMSWATDPTHDDPATKTYAGKTFLDAANTPGNAGDNDVAYLNYGVMKMDSKRNDWGWFSVTGTWGKSNSSLSLPAGATGFCTPSSSSEFYGYAIFHSAQKISAIDIYVTGTEEIGFIWTDKAKTDNKWIVFTLKEVAEDGTESNQQNVNETASSTSIQYNKFSSLNKNKYYHLKISTAGADNSRFWSITFKRATYTVSYELGDGDGTPASFSKCQGETFTLHDGKEGVTAPDGKEFSKWKDQDDNEYAGSAEYTMPAKDVTLTAQWINEVVRYTITKGAYLNGDLTISPTKAGVGETVNIAATPSPGYAFVKWQIVKTSDSEDITGLVSLSDAANSNATFIMPGYGVTINATFAVPNIYYYKDATHYNGESYKNPEGDAAVSGDDKALTTPWTICNACVVGIERVVATGCTYDTKTGDIKYMTSYIKIPTGGNKDDKNITFTISDGYSAVLKMKMGPWAETLPTITLQKLEGSTFVKTIGYSGSIGGNAQTEDNFNELTWNIPSGGTYVMTVTTKNTYVSQIDIQTTQVVTVTEAQYATYYNEKAYVMPTGLEGYAVTAANKTTGALTLAKAYDAGDVVIANEPLVLHATSVLDSETSFTLNNTSESGSHYSGNLLSGARDGNGKTTGGELYYRLSYNDADAYSDLGFYWGADEGAAFEIAKGKAYLPLSAGANAPSRFLINAQDNTATNINNTQDVEDGIKFIQNGKLFIKKNGVVYDMMGTIVK